MCRKGNRKSIVGIRRSVCMLERFVRRETIESSTQLTWIRSRGEFELKRGGEMMGEEEGREGSEN